MSETTETREYSNGWCCVDCLMLLANGEKPPEMGEDETAAWLAEIDRRTAGTDVTLGRMFGEEDCEHTSEDWRSDSGNHADQCESLEFSWSPCDVCGSRLGGERAAVTFWLHV